MSEFVDVSITVRQRDLVLTVIDKLIAGGTGPVMHYCGSATTTQAAEDLRSLDAVAGRLRKSVQRRAKGGSS